MYVEFCKGMKMEQTNQKIATQAVTELVWRFMRLIAIYAVMFLAMEEVLSWYPNLGHFWRSVFSGLCVLTALSFDMWLNSLIRRAALAKRG